MEKKKDSCMVRIKKTTAPALNTGKRQEALSTYRG